MSRLQANQSTFTFRKRWGQIDWRTLASVDVDRIAREMDFQSLQQNIMNVTFCNMESEEFHNVDQNFIKLFRLAQLIIEYLLHCQQYLSEQSTESEQRVQEAQQALEKASAALSAHTAELKNLKKENKKRKKIIQAYQDMLNAGATGIHSCPVCQREFVSKEYLQSHVHRRHPDHSAANETETKRSVTSQEELEKRLLEQMTERLQATETQLKDEMYKKEHESLQRQAMEFEQWKTQEQERMKLKLHEFKEPILSELKVLQQEKAQLEQELLQKQAEIEVLSTRKPSHLGHLEGAQEMDIHVHGSRKRQAELEKLKEQLELKVDGLQTSMRHQEKSWQKKLQKLSSSYQEQIKDLNQKLSILEQSLQESTIASEKDRVQSSVQKQLSSLKKKIKDQEEQLQRQDSTVLQTREPTPSPPYTPLRVSENPPTSGRASLAKVPVTYSDTEDSVFDSESDKDEVDSPQHHYTPLPHRPMIKTRYAHSTEVIESIKQETESIVSDALQQRGLPKGTKGLSSEDLLSMFRSLEQEREQRVQTNNNFFEHRERLVQEIESTTVSVPYNQRKARARSSMESTNHIASDPSASKSKPPLPTPTRSQPGYGLVSHHHPREVATAEPLSSDSDETVSSVKTLEPVNKPVPSQPAALTVRHDDSSPWDSEEDSIEMLGGPAGGRTSSTPIKSGNGNPLQKVSPPHTSIITIEPNPARKPVGGIPMFKIPPVSGPLDDDNSFDRSEPNLHSPTAAGQGNLKSSLRGGQTIQTVNPMSQTGTSRSPLTTVSVDEFGDSDFSDLDL